MKTKIHILKEEVINKIAAGEVIERPFSVVKELIENSIDAGAKKIILEVEDGGKKLIRVVDDGCGMSKEDAVMSLKRHATSKIQTEEDLQRIETLGFRGEALPSISAVSEITIITRREDENFGIKVSMKGGQELNTIVSPSPKGTSVEVQNLFFNVPARKKFLRSSASEFSRIVDIVNRFALFYKEINFKLIHNKKTVLCYPPESSSIVRAFQVLGEEIKGRLFLVNEKREWIEVEGFASDPELTRQDAQKMFFYVNGRYVNDMILKSAVLKGYENLIPKGKYPYVVMFLKIAPEMVDVNVHPQKIEVRFSDGKKVFETLYYAIRNLVSKSPWISSSVKWTKKAKVLPEFVENKKYEIKKEVFDFYKKKIEQPLEKIQFSKLNVIGQFHSSFIICEGEGFLWLIDQHRAHERVNFEKLKRELKSENIESQKLLFPCAIEFYGDFYGVERGSEILNNYGFEIEKFSGNMLIVHAVPALIGQKNHEKIVRELISLIKEEEKEFLFENMAHKIISTIACHSSFRAGDNLSIEEIKNLLYEMEKIDIATLCPHGRKVAVKFLLSEVESWFGRT